jgi:glycosyltransferase involved in cell wall biosynthesis
MFDRFLRSPADVHVFAAAPYAPITYKPRTLIYDCMDEWSAFDGCDETLALYERELCAAADTIWVVSRSLESRFRAVHGDKIQYVPNGVDYRHFYGVPAERRVPGGKKVLGYIGMIASWFDCELVASVADRLPDWDIHLIGPHSLGEQGLHLLARPNIALLGPAPYAELPTLMGRFTVAMIPFRLNALTIATSPIKLYEYLAAGVPVVSTPMPEVLQYQESEVVACHPEPDAFASAVRDLARSHCTSLCQDIAKRNSWKERFQDALSYVLPDAKDMSTYHTTSISGVRCDSV